MYFCHSWFSNMVSFRYVFVVLNFLHDIFSIKFYTISFLWDLFTISFTIFLLMRNITRWMLDTEVKVFHERISYSMKWPWNCIAWNALKENFHSVPFPLETLVMHVLSLIIIFISLIIIIIIIIIIVHTINNWVKKIKRRKKILMS